MENTENMNESKPVDQLSVPQSQANPLKLDDTVMLQYVAGKKVYSVNQIGIATFLGGPLIGAYLLSENFKLFQMTELAKKTLMYGVVGTLLFFVIVMFLTDVVKVNFPSSATAPAFVATAYVIAKNYQQKYILDAKEHGVLHASSWGVLGKSIMSFIVTILLVFAIGMVMP